MPDRHAVSPERPRQVLLDPPPSVFDARDRATAALQSATQDCAALAADVQAMVAQAIADLEAAVTRAEVRIEAATESALARLEGHAQAVD